jgi:hypothetical protein
MAPRGRPALTEEILRERTSAYCKRYGVTDFNAAGLPAYPAGKRESRQHRDWVNLFKAWSRFRGRMPVPGRDAERAAVLRAQKGRCPICTSPVETTGVLDEDRQSGRIYGLLHAECDRLVRLARAAGTGAVECLRSYLSAAATDSRTKDA